LNFGGHALAMTLVVRFGQIDLEHSDALSGQLRKTVILKRHEKAL